MAAIASAYAAPKCFQVVFERRLESGETTQHTVSVEAYHRDVAETFFHWRVDVPKDVTSQTILEISPINH